MIIIYYKLSYYIIIYCHFISNFDGWWGNQSTSPQLTSAGSACASWECRGESRFGCAECLMAGPAQSNQELETPTRKTWIEIDLYNMYLYSSSFYIYIFPFCGQSIRVPALVQKTVQPKEVMAWEATVEFPASLDVLLKKPPGCWFQGFVL